MRYPTRPITTDLLAAVAAWPVITLMHNGAQARPWSVTAARA